MAKIIGDCATICDKIDTILRKLRTGSVMARIKWLFKEKEIVKLLRLRGLKLSLLHVLSMSHTLEADVMMRSRCVSQICLCGIRMSNCQRNPWMRSRQPGGSWRGYLLV